jgi:hypothetical protein
MSSDIENQEATVNDRRKFAQLAKESYLSAVKKLAAMETAQPFWVSQDGTKRKVVDMTNQHLINTVLMIGRGSRNTTLDLKLKQLCEEATERLKVGALGVVQATPAEQHYKVEQRSQTVAVIDTRDRDGSLVMSFYKNKPGVDANALAEYFAAKLNG